MPYYSGIDYQTRQAVHTLEDQFEDANRIEFLRDQGRESVSRPRRIQARLCSLCA
jgi:hypothetical protein